MSLPHDPPPRRKLHHTLRNLRRVPLWLLALLLVASLVVFVLAYRQNNLTALQLRDTLLQVDKDNGDVEGALRDLREFTYSHMNAGLAADNGVYPPIQLKYRYDRLVAEANAKAAEPRDDRQIAIDAANHCNTRVGVRNDCVSAYLEARVTAQPPTIPDALYKFDFAAPIWSPDLAGWSLVAAVFLAMTLVIKIASQRWLESRIRNHA
ncbi:hypothetical protein CR970_00395 [Candidatus Saccharibacteria bacterium]|nr:MAG: hypothetical protein CR970_00395 [Candidatus Saccharibacteria bacterium]